MIDGLNRPGPAAPDGGAEPSAAERNVPESSQIQPPLCRFHSQGKHCRFGSKCRFLHTGNRAPSCSPGLQDVSTSQPEHHEQTSSRTTNVRIRAAPAPRPCRYFLSGFCSMEERCRFLHPAHMPPVEDPPHEAPPRGPQPRGPQPRGPQPRGPDLSRDLKLSDLTEDMVQKLRLTEIQQLKKRFPKDLIVQEQQGLAYYRATVEATDPDWPFDLKEVDIMVSFPDSYPDEIFTLEIPLDQQLPPVMAKHVEQASVQWLQAKHATNKLLGKVELLFRPFLRWLDRSLERLFIEGAKQLKKDLDLEKAGLQFISYQELQAAVSEKQTEEAESERTEGAESKRTEEEDSERTEGTETEQTGEMSSEQTEEEGVHLVENIRLQERPKGTEVQLLGLRLGLNTVTVMTQKVTVCLRCNRSQGGSLFLFTKIQPIKGSQMAI
ncbi:zinc finger CCCH domain-containing protein 18 [Periophthalmus magnuspinnatus]|uniref:zinc finger CCCH domain-containing protein 18 n=1 Tax=Periophthalmus magnuspinnatus TaxID=409849 RepID=UPI00145BCAB1|nr:zinc finger CCCH domain-containing protein 18 [Periophthalmus magnuspinnatus]